MLTPKINQAHMVIKGDTSISSCSMNSDEDIFIPSSNLPKVDVLNSSTIKKDFIIPKNIHVPPPKWTRLRAPSKSSLEDIFGKNTY